MVTHKKTGQKLTKIDRSKGKAKKTLADAIAKLKEPAPGLKLTHVNGKPLDGSPPTPRQAMIPGTEPPHYKELGGLAEVLADAKETAKLAGKGRKKAHDDLVRAMKQRGVAHYVDRGLNIEICLEANERVKIKKFTHRKEKRGRGR